MMPCPVCDTCALACLQAMPLPTSPIQVQLNRSAMACLQKETHFMALCFTCRRLPWHVWTSSCCSWPGAGERRNLSTLLRFAAKATHVRTLLTLGSGCTMCRCMRVARQVPCLTTMGAPHLVCAHSMQGSLGVITPCPTNDTCAVACLQAMPLPTSPSQVRLIRATEQHGLLCCLLWHCLSGCLVRCIACRRLRWQSPNGGTSS